MADDQKITNLPPTTVTQINSEGQTLQGAGISNAQTVTQSDLFGTSNTSNSVNNLSEATQQDVSRAAMSAQFQMDKLDIQQGVSVDEVPHSFNAVGRQPLVMDVNHPLEAGGSKGSIHPGLEPDIE